MRAVIKPIITIRSPPNSILVLAIRPIHTPNKKRKIIVIMTEIVAAVIKSEGNKTKGISGSIAAGRGETPWIKEAHPVANFTADSTIHPSIGRCMCNSMCWISFFPFNTFRFVSTPATRNG
jgi:hypothetical protein